MILKGSQRSSGSQLARHLMNVQDNEHVEIHDIRGFVSDNLPGAFNEAHAVSKGTKCTQYLFSLSLSPPETESAPVEVFEAAISEIEVKMGLSGQPRAIIFHEKEGRRHAHCVWSRIDVAKMKAINLPHYKLKLRDISRQLYLDHGWHMPRGLMNSAERDPLNFTIEEWQQANRVKQDPRVLKQIFQDCWTTSDSHNSFANALKERGFYLAKGDRRGHVAVDWRGETYAISRWVGIKAKDVRARLRDCDELPTVDETKAVIAERFTDKLKEFCAAEEKRFSRQHTKLESKRSVLVASHRKNREALQQSQKLRTIAEVKERSTRLPTGLKALWFRVTGKYRKICGENNLIFKLCTVRDRKERQELIGWQLRERRELLFEYQQIRHHHAILTKKLHTDMGGYLKMLPSERENIPLHPDHPHSGQKRKQNRTREL